jgi:hypothetical protein
MNTVAQRITEAVRALAGKPSRTVIVQEAEHPTLQDDRYDWFFKAGVAGSRKAAKASLEMVESNPMARRVLTLNTDFVVGGQVGFRIDMEVSKKAQQEEIQKELESWRRTLGITPEWCQRLWKRYLVEGELAIRWLDFNGLPRPLIMSTIGLDLIKDAETDDPLFLERQESGRKIRYRVLNSLSVDLAAEADGDVLYFRHDLMSGDRGFPDMKPILNRLKWEDETASLGVRRVKSMLRWFWTVVMEGADQDALDKMNRDFNVAPPTGSVRWVNEKVRWDAVSPNLGADEIQTFGRNLRSTIAGAAGHPSHWHGDGGDTNLATAQAMSEPTYQQMERFQSEFQSIIGEILDHVVKALAEVGRVGGIAPGEYAWDITLPHIDSRDYERGTRSLAQAIEASNRMVELGYIKFEAGQRISREVAQRVIGVEISEDDLGEEPDEDPYSRNPPPLPPGADLGGDDAQGDQQAA